MNTLTKAIFALINTFNPTLKRINTKNTPQKVLFLLTGFLVSQFFLLNILYSQHPLGGWVTPFGNISTLTIIAIVLVAIAACLITLWRSATDITSSEKARRKTPVYSKPATFMRVSPE